MIQDRAVITMEGE